MLLANLLDVPKEKKTNDSDVASNPLSPSKESQAKRVKDKLVKTKTAVLPRVSFFFFFFFFLVES